jgi:hypothetical protein
MVKLKRKITLIKKRIKLKKIIDHKLRLNNEIEK